MLGNGVDVSQSRYWIPSKQIQQQINKATTPVVTPTNPDIPFYLRNTPSNSGVSVKKTSTKKTSTPLPSIQGTYQTGSGINSFLNLLRKTSKPSNKYKGAYTYVPSSPTASPYTKNLQAR